MARISFRDKNSCLFKSIQIVPGVQTVSYSVDHRRNVGSARGADFPPIFLYRRIFSLLLLIWRGEHNKNIFKRLFWWWKYLKKLKSRLQTNFSIFLTWLLRKFRFLIPMDDIASCHPFNVINQFRPMQWITGYFPRTKRPGSEAGHLPLSIVEFQNKWSSTSNRPLPPCGA